MADMTLKWEAHDKNVVAELDKMNKAMEGLREQNRKLSEETKHHHDETHGWMQEQVHSIGAMAASYVTVEKAIEAVTGVYDGWKDKMKEVAESHEGFIQKLMRDLTMAGDAAHADQIKTWAESGGGTPEQKRQALAGVTQAAPQESLERRLELANQVSRQAASGIDMGAAGQAAGNLARIAPGKSADDVQDINMLLMQKLRGGSERLTGDAFLRGIAPLIESGGMSLEDALGLGASATAKNQKLGFMTHLGELATASQEDLTKDIKPGVAPTTDQIARSKLAGMNAKERIEAVMGDHELAVAGLGKDAAYQLGRNTPGEIAKWRQEMLAAQANNIGSRVAGADTEVGRAALGAQSAAEQEAAYEARLGPGQALLARARKSARQGALNVGYGERVVEGGQQSLESGLRFFGAQSVERELRRYQGNPAVAQGVQQEITKFLEELASAVKENTQATKDNSRATGGGAAISTETHGEHHP